VANHLREQLTSSEPSEYQLGLQELWRMLDPSVGRLVDRLLPRQHHGQEAQGLKEEIICALLAHRGRLALAEDIRQAATDLSLLEIHWYFLYRDWFEETGWGER
jgi:hypothetical protein